MTAATAGLPSQRTDDDSSLFPLILQWDGAADALAPACDWIVSQRAALDEQVTAHGTILFRGFPLTTAEDFDCFITAFGYPIFTYEDSLSNAVRTNRTSRVFTANEAPSSVTIQLHHEMAQTPIYPSRLFFFCEKPAETGGQTPLCRSDILFARIRSQLPKFATDCEQKGLLYSHVMPGQNDSASGMGRSWQSTWNASTTEEAEHRMSDLGYSWEWLNDGCLRVTTPRLPAVRSLDDGRTSFFNQLIAAFHGWKDERNDPSKSITFGDGSPLDVGVMNEVIGMAEDLTFDVPWQSGDVALVDNYVTMHGRRRFTGKRSVLASLVAS